MQRTEVERAKVTVSVVGSVVGHIAMYTSFTVSPLTALQVQDQRHHIHCRLASIAGPLEARLVETAFRTKPFRERQAQRTEM